MSFHLLPFWDHSYLCLACTNMNLAHLTKDVSGASAFSNAQLVPPFRNEHLLLRKALLINSNHTLACCAGPLRWAAWSRSLLVPPPKYRASCAAWLPYCCVESWWFLVFAASFSTWHQRLCPVWGVTTLSTTLERLGVALRCCTEVFIFDVTGPPSDVH